MLLQRLEGHTAARDCMPCTGDASLPHAEWSICRTACRESAAQEQHPPASTHGSAHRQQQVRDGRAGMHTCNPHGSPWTTHLARHGCLHCSRARENHIPTSGTAATASVSDLTSPMDVRLMLPSARMPSPLVLHCCIGAGKRSECAAEPVRQRPRRNLQFCLTTSQQQDNAQNTICKRLLNTKLNDAARMCN